MMAPFSSYVPHLIVFLDLGGLLSPSITAVLLPSLPELHTHTHTHTHLLPPRLLAFQPNTVLADCILSVPFYPFYAVYHHNVMMALHRYKPHQCP